jgi:hypothetical protein
MRDVTHGVRPEPLKGEEFCFCFAFACIAAAKALNECDLVRRNPEARDHGNAINDLLSHSLASKLGVFDPVVDRLVFVVGHCLAGAAVRACRVCGVARCRKSPRARCRPRLGQSPIDEIWIGCVDTGASLAVRAWRAAVARARLADRLYNLAQLDQLSVEAALAPLVSGLGEEVEAEGGGRASKDGEGALATDYPFTANAC